MNARQFLVSSKSLITRTLPSFSFFFALIPAAYVLYLALNSGELPSNDYWHVLYSVYTMDGFSANIADWLSRHNEHVMFIPRVIYALNIIVTHGSNIGLSLATWVFALVQSYLLLRLLPHQLRNSRLVSATLVFGIAAFVFTPSAAHNWILGFSGVAWIGANMLVIASIFCLTRFRQDEGLLWAVGSVFLAALATFTYTTSLVLWPVLCAGLVLMRSRFRFILLFVAFTVVAYVGYFLGYATPAYHPSPIHDKISGLLLYMATYLGAIFTINVEFAAIIGALGLLIPTLVVGRMFFRGNDGIPSTVLPWLLIQAYAVGTSAMAAVGRSGFGAAQATSSRYASLPALFWISSIVVILFFLQPFKIRRGRGEWALILTTAVVGLLVLLMYQVGTKRSQELLHRVSLQPLASLSVQLGMPDKTVIELSITPSTGRFLKSIPVLKAHGHVPFAEKNNLCGEIDQRIDPNLLKHAPQVDVLGYFDFLDQFVPAGARVVGWAYSADRHVKCIVLLNQENVVRGFAIPWFNRPDVAQVLDMPDHSTGWVGYVCVPSENEKLTAYALFTEGDSWIPLRNSHSLQSPGEINYSIYQHFIDNAG